MIKISNSSLAILFSGLFLSTSLYAIDHHAETLSDDSDDHRAMQPFVDRLVDGAPGYFNKNHEDYPYLTSPHATKTQRLISWILDSLPEGVLHQEINKIQSQDDDNYLDAICSTVYEFDSEAFDIVSSTMLEVRSNHVLNLSSAKKCNGAGPSSVVRTPPTLHVIADPSARRGGLQPGDASILAKATRIASGIQVDTGSSAGGSSHAVDPSKPSSFIPSGFKPIGDSVTCYEVPEGFVAINPVRAQSTISVDSDTVMAIQCSLFDYETTEEKINALLGTVNTIVLEQGTDKQIEVFNKVAFRKDGEDLRNMGVKAFFSNHLPAMSELFNMLIGY